MLSNSLLIASGLLPVLLLVLPHGGNDRPLEGISRSPNHDFGQNESRPDRARQLPFQHGISGNVENHSLKSIIRQKILEIAPQKDPAV